MPPRLSTTNRLLVKSAYPYPTLRVLTAAKNKTRKRLEPISKGTDKRLGPPLSVRKSGVNHVYSNPEGARDEFNRSGHKVIFRNFKNKSEHKNGEVTSVPNPTPDIGFQPTQPQIPGYPPTIASQSVSHGPTALIHQTQSDISPTFIPLPPLLSLDPSSVHISSPLYTAPAFSSSIIGFRPTNAASKTPEKDRLSTPHKLSTPLIVLLAVGSGLLLAGILIMIKFCSRPARRPRLIPSRPILDDPFADDRQFQTKSCKESPVFGGKERLSSRPGSNGLWSWTQYSPKKTQATSKNPGDNPYEYGSMSHSPRLQGRMSYSSINGKAQYHFAGHSHTKGTPVQDFGKPSHEPPFQQDQGNPSRIAKRVSIASMSLYGASPRPSQIGGNVTTKGPNTGTAYPADGQSTLERIRPRTSINNGCGNPVDESTQTPGSGSHGDSRGTAYDGADISSPAFLSYTIPQPDVVPIRGGRTRIKSSYYASGAYPRVSELPPHSPITKANNSGRPRERDQPSVRRIDSRRDRDAQGLTSMAGSVSPMTEHNLPSPQPTLYPDDSLSVVDLKRPTKASVKKIPSNRGRDPAYSGGNSLEPIIATAQDASAALGSLMLLEFSGPESHQKTLNLRNVGNALGSSLLRSNSGVKKRSEEKAPSIPLPPLLPSLTQMGLEHANPQAYADYRSPTYSIYGLYEGDRKSGFGQ